MNVPLRRVDLSDGEGGNAPLCRVVVHGANDTGHQHEAAALAQLFAASLRTAVSDDDPMEPGRREVRQVEWEGLGTGPVEKQEVGMSFNPTLGPPNLIG